MIPKLHDQRIDDGVEDLALSRHRLVQDQFIERRMSCEIARDLNREASNHRAATNGLRRRSTAMPGAAMALSEVTSMLGGWLESVQIVKDPNTSKRVSCPHPPDQWEDHTGARSIHHSEALFKKLIHD